MFDICMDLSDNLQSFAVADHCGAEFDVEKYFSNLLSEDQSLSAGIAAIKTLLMVLKKTKCKCIDAPSGP